MTAEQEGESKKTSLLKPRSFTSGCKYILERINYGVFPCFIRTSRVNRIFSSRLRRHLHSLANFTTFLYGEWEK